MRYSLIIFGLSTVFLAGCGTTQSIIEGAEVEVESGDTSPQTEGAEVESGDTSPQTEGTEVSQAQALLLSYEEAVVVREVVQELYKELDTNIQEALDEPLAAFSADIEALKYYTDLADREPLLDADHIVVLEITARIEEALAFFTQILELVL